MFVGEYMKSQLNKYVGRFNGNQVIVEAANVADAKYQAIIKLRIPIDKVSMLSIVISNGNEFKTNYRN